MLTYSFSKHSFARFIFLIIFFVIIFKSTQVRAETFDLQTDKCNATVDKLYISKDLDDTPNQISQQNWEIIPAFPYYWNKHWDTFPKQVWYKVHWDYQCRDKNLEAVTLVIENLNMAGKLYINGELIWQSQSLVEPYSRQIRTPLKWVIPPSSLKVGANTFEIQVLGVATQNSGIGKFHIGDHADLNQIYDSTLLQKQTLNLFNLAINLIIALFCFMVWFSHRRGTEFIWFSLLGFAWSIYLLMAIIAEPWSVFSNLFFDKLHIFSFCCYVSLSCIAVWRFAGKKYPKIEKALVIFLILSILFIFFSPDQYQPMIQKVFFITGVIIFLLKAATYPIVAYKTQYKEAYFLVFVQIIFFPIAINDAYHMLTNQGYILSPYTAPISSLFIGFVLALRLANNTKRIETFSKTLEDTITKTKNDLTQSLSTQYNLELENAKLQERINLSHDLHDGLGGSISRSMILLERNDHLEKDQMMSMLKLLRSDLRQVIDFGSSINSKVADSPILWVAPLRHRFIQLFEEMDIQSTWLFASKWDSIPQPIQALTLARVAEEALNNIVKHSGATQVTVSLNETDEPSIVLEIKDNGVGFDPNFIHEGLHVGLHSMLVRVQRVGGFIDITSQPHETVIRVTFYRPKV